MLYMLLILLAIAIPNYHLAGIRITSNTCTSDSNFCQNPVCKLKALNRYEQLLQIGCPVQSKVPSSWLLIEHLQMSNSGYQPGYLHNRLDLCAVLDRKTGNFKFWKALIDNFSVGVMNQLDRQWISCPFPSKWLVNLTLDERQNVLGPVSGVVPAGEHRVHLRISTKKANKTVYDWNFNLSHNK